MASIIAAFYSCDIYLPKQFLLKFKTFKYGFIILTNNSSPFELHSSYSITYWLSVRELLISNGYAGIFEQTLHILTTPWLSPSARILQGCYFHSKSKGLNRAQLIEEAWPIKAWVALKFWLLLSAKASDTLLSSKDGHAKKLKSGDQHIFLIYLTVLTFLRSWVLGDNATYFSLAKDEQLYTVKMLFLPNSNRYLPKGSKDKAEIVRSRFIYLSAPPSSDLIFRMFLLLTPPRAITVESGLQAISLISMKSSLRVFIGTNFWSSSFHN